MIMIPFTFTAALIAVLGGRLGVVITTTPM
jgi:prolipoprotein diacylglyceryltransferase